ncbi:hypothetical protein FIBSPDRAFT_781658 [Athelia psychrophila]|uniref:RBR-type E3 ubiquitin transferase n=1 Tax=Athelia psychrophila TaxID=1759441 RepID=A0A166Q7J5_9AGAM|nr:hypothetical protein FIBSPDRAFT_781658 [Fibularhizoctonia sp. CBS 109695]
MSMVSEAPTGKPQVAFPNDQTRSRPNNQTQHIQATNHLKLDGKCCSFIQGHCKFGDLCKRSHGDPPSQVTQSPTVRMPIDVAQTQVPHHTSRATVTFSNVLGQPTTSSTSTLSRLNARTTTPHSNPSPRTIPPKQANKPCLSWAKSGTCQLGSKCRYDHNVNVALIINRERQEKAARIDRTHLGREAAEAEIAQKVQQAQEEVAVERARQAALRQTEVERVRARAHQAKQQAELLQWDRVQEVAAAAAAEAADRARQETVSRIEEGRRARETVEVAQKAQEDAARRAEARRAREARQEEAQRVRQAEQERAAAETALKAQEAQEKASWRAEARRVHEVRQEEARRARQAQQKTWMVNLIKEEAAMTMQHIVLDFTVVTFSTGLAIQHVLLGFESCRITIKNLPIDATAKEVCELFTQQGIEPGRFHVLGLAMTPARKQEAFLIGHEDLKMVAIALEEVDFRQERLSFEIMGHSGRDGMTASALDANTLTLTWRAPSFAYIVTCVDGAQAKAKGHELDRKICRGRQVKTQINQHSLGRRVLIRLIEESLHVSNIVPRADHTKEDICPICHDVVTLPIKLSCGHAYCGACIRHFLTSASTFPLVCIGDEDKCHAPIPIPLVQRFLPIQQFTNLLETAFIAHIDHHPRDFKYCTTPDCRQVYRCTTSDAASIIHCPSCLSRVCSACHEEGHEGMTCAERKLNNDPEEQERLNDELASQSGFKKCPQCTTWIEKTEGCNHVECKCGAHICWVCMGIFDAGSVYRHMRTDHGGIYEANGNGEGLPFQGADFAEQQEVLRRIALRRAQITARQFDDDAEHRRPRRFGYPTQQDREAEARAHAAEIQRRAEHIRRAEQERIRRRVAAVEQQQREAARVEDV